MYKIILLITIFVSQIVTSALIQDFFPSDFSNFDVVEVIKFHKDENVPSGFVIDEVEFVLIDYTKPMPKIPVLGDESEDEADNDCIDEEFERQQKKIHAIESESGSEKELEL